MSAMCEKNLINKRTPLRNSNSANKPFRSPLSTLTTPTNGESPKNCIRQSPIRKNVTPKRCISQFRRPIGRRCIENTTNSDDFQNSAQSHRLALQRIRNKRLEMENLKTKSNCLKKHNREDLLARIDKWRTACKEALYKFHKDVEDKSPEAVSMRQVLSMLGVPENIVKFTPTECDTIC